MEVTLRILENESVARKDVPDMNDRMLNALSVDIDASSGSRPPSREYHDSHTRRQVLARGGSLAASVPRGTTPTVSLGAS